jgi:universal stress protein A
MSYPFRRILCPIDFDDNSLAALDVAAHIARDNQGTVVLAHIVPMVVPPTGMPVYVDIYKGQEEAAQERMREIATRRMHGVEHSIVTMMGEPSGAILRLARRYAVDLIVMATHGRRGFSRVLLGSIAEMVLREAPCPVLCVRRGDPDKHLVGAWMSSTPVTAAPDEKLDAIHARMEEGHFRSVPVVENGHLIGLISDRDVRMHSGRLDSTEARYAMGEDPLTVTSETPLHDATRMAFECKLDSIPVLEGGKLVGVITTSDLLRASLEQD